MMIPFLLFFGLGSLLPAFAIRVVKAEPGVWTVDDDGPADFSSISDAMSASVPNDIIYVRNGTYQSASVYKPLTLIGESHHDTTIMGRMEIIAPNVTIIGFTIKSDWMSVLVDGQSDVIIVDNILFSEEDTNIVLKTGRHNRVINNTLLPFLRDGCGIMLLSTAENIIENNVIEGNFCGFYVMNSFGNRVVNNIIRNVSGGTPVPPTLCNGAAIVTMSSSEALCNNIFHHNCFTDNVREVYDFSWENPTLAGCINTWDDDYPSGGNYWSDYNGTDLYSGPFQNETGSDGIGDTPYVIDHSNIDRYPLVAPVYNLRISMQNQVAYNIHLISNSTISDFHFDSAQKTIAFNAAGNTGFGFCRITIPNVIVQNAWEGDATILVSGLPMHFTKWNDTENTYIYFSYEHSEHYIVVVPEFSLSVILLLMSLTTVFVYRLPKKKVL